MKLISLKELKEIQLEASLINILDCRTAEAFDQTFISGSIFAGSQLSKVLRLMSIDKSANLYLVAPGDRENILSGLQKIGYEHVQFISDPIVADSLSSLNLMDLMITIEPDEFAMDLPFEEQARIIDLRTEEEFKKGHVESAEHFDIEELSDIGTIAEFEEMERIYLYGDAESASFIGSLMKRQGVYNFKKVLGNFEELQSIEKLNIRIPAAIKKD